MKRLIEGYLCARGVRYFRGHHDDEYFFLVDLVAGASSGRLNIHLEECEADAGAVLVTISPERYYPSEKADWLGVLTGRWNAEHPVVEAVVHGSCDPRLVGVQARGRHRPADLAGLTTFVDAAVAGGIELFGRMAGAAMPAPNPVLRDVG